MIFFIFWPLPEKLFDCPKNIILPDSGGGGGCSPPAHTPMIKGTPHNETRSSIEGR